MNKIFELLDDDADEEAIRQLLESDKAKKYPAEDFSDGLKKDLENDLQILNEIQTMWLEVTRDPKLLAFVDMLASRPVLKENKLIVFTESGETAGLSLQRTWRTTSPMRFLPSPAHPAWTCEGR